MNKVVNAINIAVVVGVSIVIAACSSSSTSSHNGTSVDVSSPTTITTTAGVSRDTCYADTFNTPSDASKADLGVYVEVTEQQPISSTACVDAAEANFMPGDGVMKIQGGVPSRFTQLCTYNEGIGSASHMEEALVKVFYGPTATSKGLAENACSGVIGSIYTSG